VVGHGSNAVECLRRALHFVPDQYRDVPLLNLANILYRAGHLHDAIAVVSEALTINDVEVIIVVVVIVVVVVAVVLVLLSSSCCCDFNILYHSSHVYDAIAIVSLALAINDVEVVLVVVVVVVVVIVIGVIVVVVVIVVVTFCTTPAMFMML